MKTFSITFAYEALEDFHCGDGLGLIGWFDAGQQSELQAERRIPIIRAETFKGLLRDACHTLCKMPFYCQEWSATPEKKAYSLNDVFNALFNHNCGDGPLYRSLRPVKSSLDSQPNPFRLLAQTAIDPKKGRAMDRSLRILECGRASTVLSGEIRFRGEKGFVEAASSLLRDGLLFLRRIGGRRSRGLGAVSLVSEPTLHELTADRPDEVLGSCMDSFVMDAPVNLVIMVEALEAVHVSAGEQTGNLLRCLDHVPGSVLLGAFRHEWRLLPDSENGKAEAARLLADEGPVSVGTLLPLPETSADTFVAGQVPLSVPISWQYEKGHGGHSLGDYKPHFLFWEQRADEETPLKRFDKHYFWEGAAYAPSKEFILRNRLSTKTGTTGDEEGNLFEVERVPAGTRFAARIHFAASRDARRFLKTFARLFDRQTPGWFGLGKGRSPVMIRQWRVDKPAPTPSPTPRAFALHVESPLLVRDGFLNFHTSLEQAIEALWTKSHPGSAFPYAFDRRFERTRTCRRFSPSGGLPHFSVLVIAPRTSCWLKANKGATEAELLDAFVWLATAAAGRGLGECTHQGFGRLRLETEKPVVETETSDHEARPGAFSRNKREEMLRAAKAFSEAHKQHIGALSVSQWHYLYEYMRHGGDMEDFIGRDSRSGKEWQTHIDMDIARKLTLFVNKYSLDFLRVLLRYRALFSQ
ncbi:MAG: RAMP superfamily CRISPR-associated protein [Solidesulfovibrio sp.]|uniref:RAMP superfamily CRISPR-associated protein n=1 Tax=Solidesulfovibrio sp. TaxID=2910990 RepID=UPI00315965F5